MGGEGVSKSGVFLGKCFLGWGFFWAGDFSGENVVFWVENLFL